MEHIKTIAEFKVDDAVEQAFRQANDLLREALPILHRAFFANYKDTNVANELYDKIKAVVGGAE